MESDLTITPFAHGFPPIRDYGVHRRIYLDTYAKRRAGIDPNKLTQQITRATKLVKVSEHTTVQQPAVIAIELASNPQEYMQSQPLVDSFNYVPVQLASKVEVEPTHKSYLDTLTYRHMQAVAQAPAAEETVFEPAKSKEGIETLFEDLKAEARLEANLRALYSSDTLTQQITTDTKSASAAHVRTIVASALACGFLAVGIFTFMGQYNAQPVVAQPIGSPVIEVEATVKQPGNGVPLATNAVVPVVADATQPVRLVIGSIGVNAPVEGLGTTPEGLIAVPQSYGVVGWYKKSSVPGKPGPAVLVGHYTGGNKGVFDNLQDLKDGDLITSTNAKGESFTYRVTAKNEYEKDKVPMAELFKSSKGSQLQIITCSGKWQAKNYDKRLVVTAELVK